jgi:hypothetical protein
LFIHFVLFIPYHFYPLPHNTYNNILIEFPNEQYRTTPHPLHFENNNLPIATSSNTTDEVVVDTNSLETTPHDNFPHLKFPHLIGNKQHVYY